MTNEEKTLLIAYLVEAGELPPDGDFEDQFMDWVPVSRWPGVRRDALQGHPRGRQGAGAEF